MDNEVKTADILAKPAGVYSAETEDGDFVLVTRYKKGMGYKLEIPTHGEWIEVRHYDKNGELEGVTYEK